MPPASEATWLAAVLKLGFPVVLSLLLLGWLRTEIMGTIDRHVAQDETRTRILRVICRNTAPNDTVSVECDRP